MIDWVIVSGKTTQIWGIEHPYFTGFTGLKDPSKGWGVSAAIVGARCRNAQKLRVSSVGVYH